MLQTGIVKTFHGQKGWGFIIPDVRGRDIFVHYSNISGEGFKDLKPGMTVEFEVKETGKGPSAYGVRVLENKERV